MGSHKIETIGELQEDQPKNQKMKPKQSEDKKKSIKVKSHTRLESLGSIDSEKLRQDNIKPKSLKPEEIEESVGVHESHELDTVGVFKQDHPKLQKLKTRQPENKNKSIEVETCRELERIESLDSEILKKERTKPKSLKPEEIEESINVQESHKIETIGELQEDQPKNQNLKPKQSEDKKKSVKVKSHARLESS